MAEPGRVTVALSGGKDSTAAVLLLRERGYDPRAVTMRLGIEGEEERLARVERLARTLSLPWEVLDLRKPFQEWVIEHFLEEYRRGRTPNPCIVCNRRLKFGLLLERTTTREGDRLATGHYAAIDSSGSRLLLAEPLEKRKSQTYFLSHISPAVLPRLLFPLAAVGIQEVRERVAGLPLANTQESQDVCFLSGRDLKSFLKERLPRAFAPGDILNPSGNVIGRHRGVIGYTVGQRRGMGVAAGRRLYVLATDVERGTVTLGEEHGLHLQELQAQDPVYWRKIEPGEQLTAKLRSQHRGEEALVIGATAHSFRLRFPRPVRAVTPGQYAVLYDGGRVIASGVIT